MVLFDDGIGLIFDASTISGGTLFWRPERQVVRRETDWSGLCEEPNSTSRELESVLKKKYNHIVSQCSKIGKKCNLKSTKTHYLHFQKSQKNQFLYQKKVSNYQKCNFRTFFWCKNRIFAIFEIANNVFLHFLNCTFFQF